MSRTYKHIQEGKFKMYLDYIYYTDVYGPDGIDILNFTNCDYVPAAILRMKGMEKARFHYRHFNKYNDWPWVEVKRSILSKLSKKEIEEELAESGYMPLKKIKVRKKAF